jgi:hypothetical protein
MGRRHSKLNREEVVKALFWKHEVEFEDPLFDIYDAWRGILETDIGRNIFP